MATGTDRPHRPANALPAENGAEHKLLDSSLQHLFKRDVLGDKLYESYTENSLRNAQWASTESDGYNYPI
jgi:hypothetical protein